MLVYTGSEELTCWIGLGLQDEAEADGGGLRVPEEVLREPVPGEPAAAEGGPGAAGPQAIPAALHALEPPHHPHHVPLLRAGRLPLHRPSLSEPWPGSSLAGARHWPAGLRPDAPAACQPSPLRRAAVGAELRVGCWDFACSCNEGSGHDDKLWTYRKRFITYANRRSI